jgi:hypothetical protein
MSVVLAFPQNPVSKRVQVLTSQSAEIVIFPGVRVERRSFDLSMALLPVRKRRVSQAAIDEETLSLT